MQNVEILTNREMQIVLIQSKTINKEGNRQIRKENLYCIMFFIERYFNFWMIVLYSLQGSVLFYSRYRAKSFIQLVFLSLFNIIYIIMQNNQKWTQPQDQILFLSKIQINLRIDWKRVSSKFNESCPPHQKRSSKECKDRYANFLRDGPGQSHKKEWSFDELLSLMRMYLEFGSSWARMAQTLPHKSKSSIKNRFYWNLRRGVAHLESHSINSGNSKNKIKISYEVVTVLLDLCNQIQNWVTAEGLTVSPDSRLFKLKREVVEYCFRQDEFSYQRMDSLIHELKQVAFDLKGYRIFRMGKGASFRLDPDFLRRIYNYDKYHQERVQLFQLLTSEKLIERGSVLQISGKIKQQEEENKQISSQSGSLANQVEEIQRITLEEEVSFIFNEHIPINLSPFELDFNELAD